uniref:DNA 3'-5' helicase n=1 Tax=Electrophorus electricus TaxID=8005 RepID=A0A4W4F1D0_ELEEL
MFNIKKKKNPYSQWNFFLIQQEQSCCMYKKNILEADLPHLEFTGTVIYSQEKNDCSFLSEDLSLAPGSAVGFDLEWPPSFTKGKSKKVALVQLCATEEKCYLFHISSMSGFPPGLKMLLEDENIRKVGVGIEGDKWKLLSDYDVKMKSFVELSDLANDKLKCMEKWSLDGLVKHLFKKKLFKNNDVRCGHWDDFELTQEQKHYAATDAYVSVVCSVNIFTIFSCLIKLKILDTTVDLIQKPHLLVSRVSTVLSFLFSCLDPNLPQPAPEMIKCLKMYFGHQNFKPVQWKVIQSIFDHRRDNLVVMATGYGKSLCFQFPPVYCKNISIVISPLIALMEDQVMQLRMSNIPACFLGSAQTQNVFADLRKGCFRVVYMTPEFCSGNIPLLHELNDSTGIVLIAVDEAHCISHWGHNFRGVYRDLGKLKRSLPDVPIVALTATASSSIRQDIVKSLHLKNPLVTCTSFDRPNLYLDVTRKTGDIIQDLKPLLVKQTWGDYKFEGAAIVYCPSKKETERVAAALAKLGIRCGVYHAGLSIQKRKDTQYQFMRDEIQCVVATIAFGMGINKPDIRKVIHYGAPKEMESYYQEMGRAGRDGMPSACHVLWLPGDMCLNRFLLIQTVSNKFRGYQMEMMAKMEKYLKSTKCRRKLILSHFEDKQLRKITSGIMGTSKCCDNWHLEPTMQDFGPHAFQLMGAVSAMGERFGITAPILLLRGSNSQKVPDRFRQQSLFGAGRGISEAWWRALSRELIFEKYLMESTGCNKFTTLCKLTPKGRSWLSNSQDEKHRTLFLHPNIDLCPRSVSSIQHGDFLWSCVCCALLKTELYGKLVVERQKLASIKDVPPAILATNKILLDMAKLRPCTVARLKMVDGVSEAKAAMLSPLLQMVAEFCQEVAAELSSATPCPGQTCGTQAAIAFALPLTYNVAVSYRLFQTEGKSLWQVADARSLPVAVVESHLLQAQRANHPLHTERAGLSPSIYNTITRIISSPPLNLSDFRSIRALVPEDISTFLIRLCVAKLLAEGVPPRRLPASTPSEDHHLSWIEPQVSALVKDNEATCLH